MKHLLKALCTSPVVCQELIPILLVDVRTLFASIRRDDKLIFYRDSAGIIATTFKYLEHVETIVKVIKRTPQSTDSKELTLPYQIKRTDIVEWKCELELMIDHIVDLMFILFKPKLQSILHEIILLL